MLSERFITRREKSTLTATSEVKTMRKLHGLLLAIVLTLATASSALASNVVGIVVDQNGNYVNDAYVTVTDSNGKLVGDARTDLYGRYCIVGVPSGTYTISLDLSPTVTALGGMSAQKVDIEGLTLDWRVSDTKPASATSTIGLASAASATCGAGYWPAAAAAGLGAIGIGGIVGGILGTEGGGGGGPVPAATGTTP
jgi:Carboxypeptidase regulatory-like domain